MRRCGYLMMVFILVACGGPAVPNPPPADAPAMPLRSVGEVGRGDYDGATITMIAPVIQRSADRTLVAALSFASAEPAPLLASPGDSVLLGGDPLAGLTAAPGGAEYGIVRVTGLIQVTADGVRQMQPTAVKILAPTSLILGELLANSATYQGQVVEIKGTLIIKPGAALLVDAVGPGGVPDASANQIKIAQANDALIEQLPEGSGELRYGSASVVGLWRGQSLTIFWATSE